MTKVSGVTFNNEDGKNRQQVLAELVAANRQIITVDLVYTTFNGEFAIQLVENTTRQTIGWVAKTELYKFTSCNIRQMTGFIGFYNGTYYTRLDMQQAPSYQDYVSMYRYCSQNGYAMPAYDVRAYAICANILTYYNYI